ncbi:MAG: hypothetical protein ABIG32_03335 [Candidatus Uhrbacteria bacterium]|nr:hypothetical protein [Patescibacteria group bacterium]MBU1906600.1 hypothetical protein [Patescibacteria group bacterium]
MDAQKSIKARNVTGMTDGLREYLMAQFALPECMKAVNKATNRFKAHHGGRFPASVIVELCFTAPERPGPHELVEITFYYFLSKVDDPQAPAYLADSYDVDVDDAPPLRMRHLGNGRYGLP